MAEMALSVKEDVRSGAQMTPK